MALAILLALQDWHADYDRARAEARTSGRLIFAFFTRTDVACPVCASVEQGVLREDAFRAFATEYVLFRHEGKALYSEKGGTGWPYIAILDAEGRLLTRHLGRATVAGFGETVRRAREFLDLQSRAESTWTRLADNSIRGQFFGDSRQVELWPQVCPILTYRRGIIEGAVVWPTMMECACCVGNYAPPRR